MPPPPLLALIAPSLRGYRRAWPLPYASIGSERGYALLGPSRRLMVGPDAATMAVLASVLVTIQQKMPGPTAAQQAAGAPLIALLVGLICFAASRLRLGNLAKPIGVELSSRSSRPEGLRRRLQATGKESKLSDVLQVIETHRPEGNSGAVAYCATRAETERVAALLR